MKNTDARAVAWRVLDETRRGAHFDGVFDDALASIPESRDRALTAELVRGVLTWQARYDHLIDHFARKPSGIKPKVRLVLRLGLHQLLALDRVPDHAAVHETVALARLVAGGATTGFVNGMLQSVRRAIAAGEGEGVDALAPLFADSRRDPAARLALWHSHPAWLVERWLERFGIDETTRLLEHDNTPPPVDLHVLTGDVEQAAADLRQMDFACEPLAEGGGLRLQARPGRDDLRRLLGERPDLLVQDASVQAATSWLGRDLNGSLLDLCAAPGGKTLHLRARLPQQEIVAAMDLSSARLQRLRDNLDRTEAGRVSVLCGDGRKTPFRDGAFDAVLLDGPCSGTGVIRHHPEGRWRLRPETLAHNHDRLLELAVEATRMLAPGGRLLYATCSLEPEENEDVLRELATAVPGMIPDPDLPEAVGRAWLPWRDGADGFFAARWKKVEE